MIRTECVICAHNSLTEFYRLNQYPITPSSSPLDSDKDEFQDCIFSACDSCGTIQLRNLIDPVKLYENSHNSTENTPTWKEHHTLFAEFISTRADTSTVLEVGGNSGVLYTLLSKRFPGYTILDICDTKNRPSSVGFLQGNCEEYDFTGHAHLILSHTFEHLYHPRKFIENLSKAAVHSVYISIPNMEYLYTQKNVSILHNEHTFFVGDSEIRYLFSQYGYSCAASTQFKNHSRFYQFIYTPSSKRCPLSHSIPYTEVVKYLTEFKESLDAVVLDRPTFICPAGHYGQKLYYYLQHNHKHIKGFIDNDSLKQGMRVYGTPCQVYSADILAAYEDTPVACLLYAGPYTHELRRQLTSINPSIQFITIE